MNKKGFTLIELLVVVLIIGILAAIALPMYTKAVEKTRAREALILGRSIQDAIKRCELEHDIKVGYEDYCLDFDNLDVNVSGEKCSGWTDNWCKETKYFQYNLDSEWGRVSVHRKSSPQYTLYIWSSWTAEGANKIACEATTEEGWKICTSLGVKTNIGADDWGWSAGGAGHIGE